MQQIYLDPNICDEIHMFQVYYRISYECIVQLYEKVKVTYNAKISSI